MKRLVLVIPIILVLVLLAATGCAEKEPTSPTSGEGKDLASSCVVCHSDKDLLKAVASPEEEEEESEATTGEG